MFNVILTFEKFRKNIENYCTCGEFYVVKGQFSRNIDIYGGYLRLQ